MELFLQITGSIVIGIILLIISVYFFFKIKFSKYLSMADEQNQTPLILHLNEDFTPTWLNAKNAKPIDKELIQLGFVRGKSYQIPEMSDVELTVYFKPPLTAVLYRHEDVGVWTDLVLEKEGDLELTISNSLLGEAAEHRPEKKIEYYKGESVSQLSEHINLYIDEDVSYKTISPDNFREYFEETYKKDIAYRTRNGGMSYEEFLSHKQELGKKTSKKDTHEAFIITKEQELSQWSEAAIAVYTKALSEQELEKLYDKGELLIVPFRTEAEAFIRYLDMEGFINDEDKNISKDFKDETDIFQLFDKLNGGKSPELRATYLDELNYPLQLKVYQYPYS